MRCVGLKSQRKSHGWFDTPTPVRNASPKTFAATVYGLNNLHPATQVITNGSKSLRIHTPMEQLRLKTWVISLFFCLGESGRHCKWKFTRDGCGLSGLSMRLCSANAKHEAGQKQEQTDHKCWWYLPFMSSLMLYCCRKSYMANKAANETYLEERKTGKDGFCYPL